MAAPMRRMITSLSLRNIHSRGLVKALEVAETPKPDVLYKSLEVEVKGHDPAVLKSYETFVSLAARELGVDIKDIYTPPRVIERRTLLKSIHIFKKHRVQYEWRTHFRVFKIQHITGSTANTYLEYIQRNLPEGMALKATKVCLETKPSHLRKSTTTETGS